MVRQLEEDIQLSNTNLSVDEIKSFLEACRRWEYPWGIIFAQENNMHLHVLTTYRKKVFLRKYLREVAMEMFKDYPVLKTAILKSKPWALDFDLRLGWKLKREDDKSWYLEMTKEDFNYNV